MASVKVEVAEGVRSRMRRWNLIDKGRTNEVIALLSDIGWRRAHQVDIAIRHAEEEFEGKIELDEGLGWDVTYSGVTVMFMKGERAGHIFILDVLIDGIRLK